MKKIRSIYEIEGNESKQNNNKNDRKGDNKQSSIHDYWLWDNANVLDSLSQSYDHICIIVIILRIVIYYSKRLLDP